ncbi:MAG: tripartite tricarboxylate transporter substrate binding protein [Pseudolabrys sp.]|nr:tripartite tricarboxylate transporter substrate binding protein [Pseudolabrys sp.]
MDRRRFVGLSGAAAAAHLFPFGAARAQAAFPQSSIRLVVPYAAGGVVDVVGRQWANAVKSSLGTVVIENQGGGGGTIGAASVARATPDGYTLLFGDTSNLVVAPYVMKNIAYDPTKDFAPISLVATSSTAIVVHSSVPVKTLEEFIVYAKANQQKLSYASAGTGTVTHLAGELFKQLVGAPAITHVPYRGAGPGLNDLVAGTVLMMTPNVTGQVLGFHRTGQIRILAVCAPRPLKIAPEIPAAREKIPGLVVQLTTAIVGPAGLPTAIAAKISAATAAAVKDESFIKAMEAAGLEAQEDATPATARTFLVEENKKLMPVIKSAGLEPT